MPRDNRPPQRICSGCGGKGTKMVPKQQVVRGKPATVMVPEVCKTCGGVGWINR